MSAFLIDLAERALWTFVQAFVGVLVGSSFLFDASVFESAGAAGIAAVLSLLKSVAANRLEELGTAQLIPFRSGTYRHDEDAGH